MVNGQLKLLMIRNKVLLILINKMFPFKVNEFGVNLLILISNVIRMAFKYAMSVKSQLTNRDIKI